jgi:putative ABC transport system ATP-binding protein
MKDMNARDGTTFIFSTHDPKVMAHATSIVRIADGAITSREGRAEATAVGAV